MTSEVWYVTRERIAHAVQAAEKVRTVAQIDAAIASSTISVETLCQRQFYPLVATRYLDWPQPDTPPDKIMLGRYEELAELDTLTAGGTLISASDYFLRPDYGPPYTRIEIDLASSATFAANPSTSQRAIALAGTFIGCPIAEASAGTLAEDLDGAETGVDVSDASVMGVGTILRAGDERMIVRQRAALSTGQTVITTALTATRANVAVLVTDGTALHAGEAILIDSERMLIEEISGNTLRVERAIDGTVLATHSTSAGISAYRRLTVERGALGTEATTHSSGATLLAFVPPPLVVETAAAHALVSLGLALAGYASESGAPAGKRRPTPGDPLTDLRARCRAAHGRIRKGVV